MRQKKVDPHEQKTRNKGVKETVTEVKEKNEGNRVMSRYSGWIRAGRSGDRISVAAKFFSPVQTGPGAHPASCIMGIASFPWVNRAGRSVDHPPSIAEVKGRVELYLYSRSGSSWPVVG